MSVRTEGKFERPLGDGLKVEKFVTERPLIRVTGTLILLLSHLGGETEV